MNASGAVAEGARAVIVAMVAMAVSILRILAGNPDAWQTLVWAEDGLFALCARKAGAFACIVEPYEGYLLAVPKAIGALVSLAPLAQWGVATNLMAAAVVGICAAIAYGVLVASGFSRTASAIAALLPAAAPIVGVEVLNAYASANLPMLYAAVIALAFPVAMNRRRTLALYGVGLLLVVLTTPVAALLLLPIGIMAARGQLPRRSAAALAGVVVGGMALQALASATSLSHRPVTASVERVDQWMLALSNAFATLWPGVSFGTSTVFLDVAEFMASRASWWTVALGLIGLSVWLVAFGRSPRAWGLGITLGMGVVLSAAPAVAIGVNNRYLVMPVLLTAATGLLALDSWLAGRDTSGVVRSATLALLAVVLTMVWLPSLPGTAFRTQSLRPAWDDEVARIGLVCAADPTSIVTVRFSPFGWPNRPPDWQPGRVGGPATPQARCEDLQALPRR